MTIMQGPADTRRLAADAPRPLRIALVSPPMLPVPPPRYAGTERVVATLVRGLVRRGHDVTLFAPGDSHVDCELVPTVERSLWAAEYREDTRAACDTTVAKVWAQRDRFDVIHSHLDAAGLLFAHLSPVPVVSTLHGRLDVDGLPDLLETFAHVPLVAISSSQRRWHPDANWVATIHHGLELEGMPWSERPGEYLAFVGRAAPEKGLDAAIDLARETGLPLRVAAKVLHPTEREVFDRFVRPAIDEGVVEFLGEIGERERNELYAGALATVMLGAWPEPFGLVAIESLAAGTPVIARRAGALPELIEHLVDGFIVDDLREATLAVQRAATLHRPTIRFRALGRFSAQRMVGEYEAVYRELTLSPVRTASRTPTLVAHSVPRSMTAEWTVPAFAGAATADGADVIVTPETLSETLSETGGAPALASLSAERLDVDLERPPA